MPEVEFATLRDTSAVAIVTPDNALLVFPSEPRRTWSWPPDSDTDAKYAWGVTIETSDTAFLPGGQIDRGQHPAAFGTLQSVIDATRPVVLYNPGGHAQYEDRTSHVSMTVLENRVILRLEGSQTIGRLFRNHPRTVRFGVVAPLDPLWRQTITQVQYRND